MTVLTMTSFHQCRHVCFRHNDGADYDVYRAGQQDGPTARVLLHGAGHLRGHLLCVRAGHHPTVRGGALLHEVRLRRRPSARQVHRT